MPADEDDAARRRAELRAAGYDGPVDKDGNADTTSDGAQTLRRMAEQAGEDVTW